MAQRVEVLLVDDIDGTEAVETVAFSLDGKNMVIDLSADNAAKLREELAPFVEVARPVNGRRKRRAHAPKEAVAKEVPVKKAAAKKAAKKTTAKRGSSKPSTREVREWARANGREVGSKGVLSHSLIREFQEAHN